MSSSVYYFFVGMLIGGVIELIYAIVHSSIAHRPFRINHRLTITKKLSMISIPIWGILAVVIFSYQKQVLLIFIYSAIIGTILEYALGKFFYKYFGTKIWTYKHGSLGQYTSIYSIPYWGGAGLLFAMIARFAAL